MIIYIKSLQLFHRYCFMLFVIVGEIQLIFCCRILINSNIGIVIIIIVTIIAVVVFVLQLKVLVDVTDRQSKRQRQRKGKGRQMDTVMLPSMSQFHFTSIAISV